MANRNMRRRIAAIRRASRKSKDEAVEKFGTCVPFGRNVDTSKERRLTGRKPYDAPTVFKKR